jgi:hypothetical protein
MCAHLKALFFEGNADMSLSSSPSNSASMFQSNEPSLEYTIDSPCNTYLSNYALKICSFLKFSNAGGMMQGQRLDRRLGNTVHAGKVIRGKPSLIEIGLESCWS